MAVIFQKNLRNTFLYCFNGAAMHGNYIPANAANGFLTALTIYGGMQPTAAQFYNGWYSPGYNNSMLLHFSDLTLYQPNATVADTGVALINSGTPDPVAATNTGTAAWAVLWNQPYTLGTLQGTNAPQSYPKWVIIPISTLSGTLPIRMTSLSVGGSTYSIADFSITAAGGIA